MQQQIDCSTCLLGR